jgi:hypothetical protein
VFDKVATVFDLIPFDHSCSSLCSYKQQTIIDQHFRIQNIRSLVAGGKISSLRRYLMTLERRWPGSKKMILPINYFSVLKHEWTNDPEFKSRALTEWERIPCYEQMGFLKDIPTLPPVACGLDTDLAHILNLGPEDVFMRRSLTSYGAQHIHFRGRGRERNGNRCSRDRPITSYFSLLTRSR